jgi:hypothetical protein
MKFCLPPSGFPGMEDSPHDKPLLNLWVTMGICGGLTGVWCLGSPHAGPDFRFVLP